MHRALALALAVAACGGAAPNVAPEVREPTTGPTFALEVTGPSGIELGADATLAITLFGYDPGLADASASVVHTQREPLTTLPVEVAVVFPDDAAARIDQGHGPVAEAEARYYLAVEGDLDGDGRICAGDLIQAFGSRGPRFFGPAAPEEPLPMPMEVIAEGTPCQPAFPAGERP